MTDWYDVTYRWSSNSLSTSIHYSSTIWILFTERQMCPGQPCSLYRYSRTLKSDQPAQNKFVFPRCSGWWSRALLQVAAALNPTSSKASPRCSTGPRHERTSRPRQWKAGPDGWEGGAGEIRTVKQDTKIKCLWSRAAESNVPIISIKI